MTKMSTIRTVLLLVVLGPIALAIGMGVVGDTIPGFYNDVVGMATAPVNQTSNMSTILVLLLEYAPVGLGLAIIFSMFALGGFDFMKR